jgi:hypothetical protein
MRISEKGIKEFQELFEKQYGKKLSWEEASESAHNLMNLYSALYDVASKDQQRQLKLKEQPQGFHLYDGTYNCCICYAAISGEDTWYDQYGIKCLDCQRALEERTIPATACTDRDSRYAMWELNDKLGIKHQTARKMMREGRLKARIVMGKGNKPHYYLFLIEENPTILKPKKS